MKKQATTVLYFGGLWGLSEATISYLVHLFLPGMGWAFYYPLAYGFMKGAYRQTGKAYTVVLCAVLSAAIKLTNLPIVPRLDYVINPAVSILLQGLTVCFALLAFKPKDKPLVRFGLMPLATSAAWRLLYLIYLLFAPPFIKDPSILYQPASLLPFVTLELLGNAFTISLFSLGIGVLVEKFKPLRTLARGGL